MQKKGYWQTREGKVVKIKDMSTDHIYNTMRFLAGALVVDPVYNQLYNAKQMVEHLRSFQSKFDEMQKEYHDRSELPDDFKGDGFDGIRRSIKNSKWYKRRAK